MNSQATSYLEHPRLLFFLSFFIFCFGIGIGGAFSLWYFFFGVLFVGVWSILFFGWRLDIFGLFVCVFVAGFGFSEQSSAQKMKNLEKLSELTHTFSGRFLFEGTVSDLLYTSDTKNIYRIELASIGAKEYSYSIDSRDFQLGILVDIPKNKEVSLGDTLLFHEGIFPLFGEEQRGNFYRYAWYNNVFGRVYITDFEKTHEAVLGWRQRAHMNIKEVFAAGFPREVAGMLGGITIGNTLLISSEMKQDFKNSGLMHILVVSGSNITFLIVVLSFLFRPLPLRDGVKGTVIVLFLLVYGGCVGWDPPVIRAVIMGSFIYLALIKGARLASCSVLIGVAWLFLLFSPQALLFDASFGLSFGATLGIFILYPYFQKWLYRLSIPAFLVPALGVTLSASVGSMGPMIYYFGSFPLFGIFSNILIASILGILLTFCVIYIVLSFFATTTVLYLFGWLVYIPAQCILWVASLFGKLPVWEIWEPLQVPTVLLLIMVLFFGALFHEKNTLIRLTLKSK